ncbi:DUF402 domain-containing protein [Corynebacterium freiburgense]|uniref:DUF402 domain-containing protein n=1 Tax=Corynebacterium freiburgense TaxID=556548 RepID=UPI0003FB5CC2|nr:DUF402 domain-containing protein [Corynebacterium freiburgense]WJZ02258.1 hypothetical protein CFREI_04810 [Corynebacterium freiburgense]
MADLHPVKCETFDTTTNVNTDPKGFHRHVDTFKETDFGLYMARGADHPRFGYLESWLIPDLKLRVSIFHFRKGAEEEQDFYVDVVDITHKDGIWQTRDLYIDLICNIGKPVDVWDIDELSAATAAGILPAEDAEKAIEATLAAVEGITRHSDNISLWLSSRGINLTWAESVKLSTIE